MTGDAAVPLIIKWEREMGKVKRQTRVQKGKYGRIEVDGILLLCILYPCRVCASFTIRHRGVGLDPAGVGRGDHPGHARRAGGGSQHRHPVRGGGLQLQIPHVVSAVRSQKPAREARQARHEQVSNLG